MTNFKNYIEKMQDELRAKAIEEAKKAAEAYIDSVICKEIERAIRANYLTHCVKFSRANLKFKDAVKEFLLAEGFHIEFTMSDMVVSW